MAKSTGLPTSPPRRRKPPAKLNSTPSASKSTLKRASVPATATEVRDLLATALGALVAGDIDATRARAISSCAGMLLRAIQTADLEVRICRLEARAEERS